MLYYKHLTASLYRFVGANIIRVHRANESSWREANISRRMKLINPINHPWSTTTINNDMNEFETTRLSSCVLYLVSFLPSIRLANKTRLISIVVNDTLDKRYLVIVISFSTLYRCVFEYFPSLVALLFPNN